MGGLTAATAADVPESIIRMQKRPLTARVSQRYVRLTCSDRYDRSINIASSPALTLGQPVPCTSSLVEHRPGPPGRAPLFLHGFFMGAAGTRTAPLQWPAQRSAPLSAPAGPSSPSVWSLHGWSPQTPRQRLPWSRPWQAIGDSATRDNPVDSLLSKDRGRLPYPLSTGPWPIRQGVSPAWGQTPASDRRLNQVGRPPPAGCSTVHRAPPLSASRAGFGLPAGCL